MVKYYFEQHITYLVMGQFSLYV